MLTTLIAKLLAIVIVVLAVLPARHLLRSAWVAGGWEKKIALFAAATALLLIIWVLAPAGGGDTESRISDFIGVWGVLFVVIGLITIIATVLGRIRVPPSEDRER